jgi:hypothetical protein
MSSRITRGSVLGVVFQQPARLLSIVFCAGGAVFLMLALVLALTKGSLDLSVLDFYFIVLPRYLLLIAGILFTAGWIVRRLALAHP